jgi:transposase
MVVITRGDFFMIKEMFQKGMSISDISRELELARKTVRKYLQKDKPPSPQKRKKKESKLDPFKEYYCWRWNVRIGGIFFIKRRRT